MNPSWLDGAEVYDVFVWVNDRLNAGSFEEVDTVVQNLLIEELDTNILLAFLTITAAASHELPGRQNFFNRVKWLFIQRGEEEIDALLAGLESPA